MVQSTELSCKDKTFILSQWQDRIRIPSLLPKNHFLTLTSNPATLCVHEDKSHPFKTRKILTKDIHAASNKILTNKSSNCSITSSSKVFPAKKKIKTSVIEQRGWGKKKKESSKTRLQMPAYLLQLVVLQNAKESQEPRQVGGEKSNTTIVRNIKVPELDQRAFWLLKASGPREEMF